MIVVARRPLRVVCAGWNVVYVFSVDPLEDDEDAGPWVHLNKAFRRRAKSGEASGIASYAGRGAQEQAYDLLRYGRGGEAVCHSPLRGTQSLAHSFGRCY